MTTDQAKPIVQANVERLRDQLRLWDWHIDILYKRLDEGVLGNCTVQSPYCRALIEIDNDQVEDENELLRVLRHELIHVYCWPMHAYGVFTGEMTDGESSGAAWTFYLERMVWSVEQLLDANGVALEAETPYPSRRGHGPPPIPQTRKRKMRGARDERNSSGPL